MAKRDETVLLGGTQHVVIECGGCGVMHTVPQTKYDSCYREGGFWHCPNGCSRGWQHGADKQKIDNLRRERDRLKQDTARLHDEIAAEKQRVADAERKAAQVKRRALAGVCPCCNRTFTNMQRHMKSKHPNVVPLEAKAV